MLLFLALFLEFHQEVQVLWHAHGSWQPTASPPLHLLSFSCKSWKQHPCLISYEAISFSFSNKPKLSRFNLPTKESARNNKQRIGSMLVPVPLFSSLSLTLLCPCILVRVSEASGDFGMVATWLWLLLLHIFARRT